MTDDFRFYDRRWLNPKSHGGIAFVEACITEPNEYGCDASLKIGDCNRIVDLDFAAYPEVPETIDEYRHKAKTLRRAVNRFCDALIEAYDELEAMKDNE